MEKQTLKDWLIGKDLSENEEKKLEKHMDVEIQHEFIAHHEDMWISWREFGSQKHVYCWVLLKNGLAVGWNENPSRGWSFPSKKLPIEIKAKYINKKLASDRFHEEKERFVKMLDTMIDQKNESGKPASMQLGDKFYTLEEAREEVNNATEEGRDLMRAITALSADLLKKTM
jgi:hypothetical protein